MLKENFISWLWDLYRTRTLDYLRGAFTQKISYFSTKLESLDTDNNCFLYDDFMGEQLLFQKINTPRGLALISYLVFQGKPIPYLFYEEYSSDTGGFTGYTCRLDFYSSFFRYYYIGCSLSPRQVLLGVVSQIVSMCSAGLPYSLTRYDIALDIALPFKGAIMQDYDSIFSLRRDTRENITPFANTYYVGSRESKYRFYRVYNKTKDITKGHKEFLFPELLDADYTRIECQYNSGCSYDSLAQFISDHFSDVSDLSQDTFFLNVKYPDTSNSLSFDDRMYRLINSAIKLWLSDSAVLKSFHSSMEKLYLPTL